LVAHSNAAAVLTQAAQLQTELKLRNTLTQPIIQSIKSGHAKNLSRQPASQMRLLSFLGVLVFIIIAMLMMFMYFDSHSEMQSQNVNQVYHYLKSLIAL